MKKIFVAMESTEFEVDRAIDAQQAEESTATNDLTKVANYREELDKIKKEQSDDGSTDSNADTSLNGDGGDTSSGEQDTEQTNSEDNNDDSSPNETDEQSSSDAGAGDNANDDEPSENPTGDDSSTEVKEDTTVPSEENLQVAEEAIQIQSTLLKMSDVLTSSLDRGGISDSTSAIAIESVINTMKARLGINQPSNVSMESFDSISRRIVSTESLIDSMKDTVKRVWEAIVKFFKTIFAWVKEFITGAKRSEQAREEEQRETTAALMKLAKQETDEAVQKNIASKTYRARSVYLVDSDSDIDFKQMYTISIQYQKMIESFIASIETIARRFSAACTKLSTNTVDVRMFDSLQINASDFRAMNLKQSRVTVAMNIREENIVLASDPTVGNRRFLVTCSNEKYEASDASSQHQISFMKMETEDSARGGVFFTPNYEDLKVINDYIGKVLIVDERRLVNFFNREVSAINSLLQKIINAGPQIWNTIVDEEGKSFKMTPDTMQTICNELSGVLKLYSKTLINGTSTVLDSYSKHISAMNDYVNTNIRMIENSANYKKAGKTK